MSKENFVNEQLDSEKNTLDVNARFYRIYSNYTHFKLNTELLITNYANSDLIKTNIENLSRGILLVSWNAYARALLSCFTNKSIEEYTNYFSSPVDDLNAIDFFEGNLKVEFQKKIKATISKKKLNKFKCSINKFSLHLTTYEKSEIEEYRRRVTELYEILGIQMEIFYNMLKENLILKKELFDKYPYFFLKIINEPPKWKLQFTDETKGIILMISKEIFLKFNQANFED